MIKKIISSMLCFAIVCSLSIVPSSAYESSLTLPDYSDFGITTLSISQIVADFDLSSKLGVDFNLVSFNILKERIIDEMSRIKQIDRTILTDCYPHAKSVVEATYSLL